MRTIDRVQVLIIITWKKFKGDRRIKLLWISLKVWKKTHDEKGSHNVCIILVFSLWHCIIIVTGKRKHTKTSIQFVSYDVCGKKTWTRDILVLAVRFKITMNNTICYYIQLIFAQSQRNYAKWIELIHCSDKHHSVRSERCVVCREYIVRATIEWFGQWPFESLLI